MKACAGLTAEQVTVAARDTLQVLLLVLRCWCTGMLDSTGYWLAYVLSRNVDSATAGVTTVGARGQRA